MRKALSALLLMAVPVVAFTACNSQSGSGVSALPNAGSNLVSTGRHHHPHDFSTADLHAGGATFPAYAYNLGNQPVGSGTSAQQPPGNGSLFDAAPTTGTIYYCLTGSGAGRKAFEGASVDAAAPPTGACAPLGATATGFGARVDPLDFAGTDAAMASSDYAAYVTNRNPVSGTNYGAPLEIPVIGGPIVYAYRNKEFKAIMGTAQIKLSTWTMCAIANGVVTNWNDPAITADNKKAVVSGSHPITFYYRTDGSGTSYNFTFHLNAVCGTSWPAPYNTAPYESMGHSAQWTYGVNTTWPGPTTGGFIGENGNPGVTAAIQGTPYATGYAEGAWARSANPALQQMWMQNGFTTLKGKAHKKVPLFVNPLNATAVAKSFSKLTASSITFGGGSDGVPLANGGTADPRPECILYIDPSKFTHAPAGAYPISAVSYLLFYEHNNVHYTDTLAFVKWLDGEDTATQPTAASIMSSLEYVPLSKSIDTAIKTAVDHGASSSDTHPCLAD